MHQNWLSLLLLQQFGWLIGWLVSSTTSKAYVEFQSQELLF
jgi:hypothetical protein